MQALLLLKQSLEVGYDPGVLLLDGPNVRFSSADQVFSRLARKKRTNLFEIELTFGRTLGIKLAFRRDASKVIDVASVEFGGQPPLKLCPGMTSEEILSQFPGRRGPIIVAPGGPKVEYYVARHRFLLDLGVRLDGRDSGLQARFPQRPALGATQKLLQELIHLPGLRGNPSRTYPMTAAAKFYPGTFEAYTAAIIAHWQGGKDKARLNQLNEDFHALGLTWKVAANRLNDTQVELVVGRLPSAAVGGARDLVNIADVGFGVSQALPVAVALQAASPGQVVYLEQPEIHLHPRAQVALASVLARAVRRGVQVVVETHSSLLLLGIQSLAAEGTELAPEEVKLHWFTRDSSDGATVVTGADMDSKGSFGDWPEDFGKVELDLESRYLDAVDARHRPA
ncbi:MAG: AAA family ATPase [Limisphaerales bacterium]